MLPSSPKPAGWPPLCEEAQSCGYGVHSVSASLPQPACTRMPWTRRPDWAGSWGRQASCELGPCRDEVIPQDGEDSHSDATRGFSAQWKHGARFTVRAAQSLFLAHHAAACLPCSLLLFPNMPSAFLPTLCCAGSLLRHALPTYLRYVYSLVPLLIYS